MLRFLPREELGEREGRLPSIVVVHEHAGVLELIEAVLRDEGARVLATRDPFEALDTTRLLKIDLLVISRAFSDVTRDLQATRPDLTVVVLDHEPMSLDEIADAAAAALGLDGDARDAA